MSQIVKCSICKEEGFLNESRLNQKEIRKIALSNTLVCKECYSKTTGTPLSEVKPIKEYSDFEIIGLMHALMSNGCNLPDCVGCHPENFNEKGEFQKERLH